MSSRYFKVWQKVVALAPLLLLAVVLPGEFLLRCQMDGVLRSSCCCPTKPETESSIPVVKTQGCCAREVTVNARPVFEAARKDLSGVPPEALIGFAVPLAVLFVEPERHPHAFQSHGPPKDGPSVVLLKHAFLI